jgi:hypothetical protein
MLPSNKFNKQRKKHTTQMKKYEWISRHKQNFKIAAAKSASELKFWIIHSKERNKIFSKKKEF